MKLSASDCPQVLSTVMLRAEVWGEHGVGGERHEDCVYPVQIVRVENDRVQVREHGAAPFWVAFVAIWSCVPAAQRRQLLPWSVAADRLVLEALEQMEGARGRLCEDFADPVSKTEFPDYYQIIKQPRCLRQIRGRLRSRREDERYPTPLEFVKDVLLMFANCRRYNQGPASRQWVDVANTLQARFQSLLQQHHELIGDSVGTEGDRAKIQAWSAKRLGQADGHASRGPANKAPRPGSGGAASAPRTRSPNRQASDIDSRARIAERQSDEQTTAPVSEAGTVAATRTHPPTAVASAASRPPSSTRSQAVGGSEAAGQQLQEAAAAPETTEAVAVSARTQPEPSGSEQILKETKQLEATDTRLLGREQSELAAKRNELSQYQARKQSIDALLTVANNGDIVADLKSKQQQYDEAMESLQHDIGKLETGVQGVRERLRYAVRFTALAVRCVMW